jgi:DNA-binding protein HU-beta
MTKAEMITAMARGAGISKKEAAKALDSYINTVKAELRRTGKHGLVGFGTFSVVKRKSRTGRNPQTGATIQIKAKRAVKFKAGKGLREIIEVEYGGGPVPPPRKK